MGMLDKAFGVSPTALQFRSERSSMLAANIANAETPGYLAKDYDFQTALQTALSAPQGKLAASHEAHFPLQETDSFGGTLYRLPTKAISNGNTVEEEIEQAAFSDNAVRYQTSLQFLSGTIRGLRMAITGE